MHTKVPESIINKGLLLTMLLKHPGVARNEMLQRGVAPKEHSISDHVDLRWNPEVTLWLACRLDGVQFCVRETSHAPSEAPSHLEPTPSGGPSNIW